MRGRVRGRGRVRAEAQRLYELLVGGVLPARLVEALVLRDGDDADGVLEDLLDDALVLREAELQQVQAEVEHARSQVEVALVAHRVLGRLHLLQHEAAQLRRLQP